MTQTSSPCYRVRPDNSSTNIRECLLSARHSASESESLLSAKWLEATRGMLADLSELAVTVINEGGFGCSPLTIRGNRRIVNWGSYSEA